MVGRRRYFDPLYDAVVIDKHPRGNNKHLSSELSFTPSIIEPLALLELFSPFY